VKMGQEANRFIQSLKIEGQEFYIEFDNQKRDYRGSLLGYMWRCNDRQLGSNKFRIFELDINPTTSNSLFKDTLINIANEWKTCQPYGNKYKARFSDFRLLNATILLSGYAIQPMNTPYNVKYANYFKKLYESARKHKFGLWRDEDVSEEDLTGEGDEWIRTYYKKGYLKTETWYKDGKQIYKRVYDKEGNYKDTYAHKERKKKEEKRVACTMDAKVCPDGSYVSRVPPNCEFKACPE